MSDASPPTPPRSKPEAPGKTRSKTGDGKPRKRAPRTVAPSVDELPTLTAMSVRFPPGLPTVAVADLAPYAQNARTHSREQVGQIAASIREFGFNNPVLIDGKGGIVAGHGRVLAAQLLGLSHVPFIRVAYLTEDQRRGFILADNRIALNSGWDVDKLRAEVNDLGARGFEVGLLGFDDDEIKEFIAEPVMPIDGDEPEEPVRNERTFQKMTFSLHREQRREINRALGLAREMNAEADLPDEERLNPSENSNALALICESFITHHGPNAGNAGK